MQNSLFLIILPVSVLVMNSLEMRKVKCVLSHKRFCKSALCDATQGTDTPLRVAAKSLARCLFCPLKPPCECLVFVPFQACGGSIKAAILAGSFCGRL